MRSTFYTVLIYGVLVLIGGVMGYLQAGSTVSLIAGGSSGVLIIITSLIMLKNRRAGYYSSLCLSVLLTIVFAFRFSDTQKFMPAGLMVIMSLLTLSSIIFSLLKKNKKIA